MENNSPHYKIWRFKEVYNGKSHPILTLFKMVQIGL